MKSLPDHWTVVLAGNWNIRIFTPQWISEKLFKAPNIECEFAIAGLSQGLKYRSNDLVVVIKDDRLVVGTRRTAPEAVQAMEKAACAVVELLPHTPLQAAGVNFGWEELAAESEELALVSIRDAARLSTFAGNLKRTEIARTFEVSDCVLNLKLIHEPPAFRYLMNFHKKCTSPQEVVGFLSGQLETRRAFAVQLLAEAYNKSMEDNADANRT